MRVVRIHMQVATENRSKLIDTIKGTLGPVGVMSGCLDVCFSQEVIDDCALTYVAKWDTHTHMSAFLESEEMKALLVAADLSLDEPDIHFYTITEVTGIETIEDARRKRD